MASGSGLGRAGGTGGTGCRRYSFLSSPYSVITAKGIVSSMLARRGQRYLVTDGHKLVAALEQQRGEAYRLKCRRRAGLLPHPENGKKQYLFQIICTTGPAGQPP